MLKLRLRTAFGGRFKEVQGQVGLTGAFGFSIIRDKLLALMKRDDFIYYLMDRYGDNLISFRSQYAKKVAGIYKEYKSNGRLGEEDLAFLKKELPVYVKQIILSMVSEKDLFVLGNPSKGLIRNNIEDFAFTFNKDLKTNEISKGEVIDVLRARLESDLDDQCLAILLLLDNQTTEEIERIKTILKNERGFSNRTERLTAIGLKLRSDDPFLTPEELQFAGDVKIHARQLFESYKEFFSVVKTPSETYYFKNDTFIPED